MTARIDRRIRTMGMPKLHSGQRYTRLIAIEYYDKDKAGRARWRWKCDCGNEHIATAHDVRSQDVKSCGCLKRDATIKRNRESATHKKSGTVEHRTWANMISRCMNPTSIGYVNYGGRGITVCDRWRDFAKFLADLGPKPTPAHSLDRIDNDGNYEPVNCRWATHRNKQTTDGNSVRLLGGQTRQQRSSSL